MDILSIRNDFINGKVDLEAFYEDVIKKVKDNEDLNIFIDFSAENIRQRVKYLKEKLKNKEKLGSLFGISVSVKDNICLLYTSPSPRD